MPALGTASIRCSMRKRLCMISDACCGHSREGSTRNVHDHTAGEWQNQNSNPVWTDPEALVPPSICISSVYLYLKLLEDYGSHFLFVGGPEL